MPKTPGRIEQVTLFVLPSEDVSCICVLFRPPIAVKRELWKSYPSSDHTWRPRLREPRPYLMIYLQLNLSILV
jgi:hypothetical protein